MQAERLEVCEVTLESPRVRLEPLNQSHLPGLAEAIRDGELWKLPVTSVPPPEQLPAFLDAAKAAYQAGRELAFATIDKCSGRIVGSTRFRCIEAAHRRVRSASPSLAAAGNAPMSTARPNC